MLTAHVFTDVQRAERGTMVSRIDRYGELGASEHLRYTAQLAKDLPTADADHFRGGFRLVLDGIEHSATPPS